MQNWCPEPFTTPAEPPAAPPVPAADQAFRPDDLEGETQQFRREAGFSDPETILDHMSQRERALVFELVEIDVAEAYRVREEELRRELDQKYAADLAEVTETTRASPLAKARSGSRLPSRS